MNDGNRHFYGALNVAMDVIIIALAYVCAFFLLAAFYYPIVHPMKFDELSSYYLMDRNVILLMVCYALFCALSFLVLGVYRYDKAHPFRKDVNAIFGVCLTGAVLLAFVLFLCKDINFSRPILVTFYFVAVVALSVRQALTRAVLNKAFSGTRFNRHAVVVGSGNLAQKYISTVNENSRLGILVDGYFGEPSPYDLGRYLGSYKNIGEVLASRYVDEVVIALEASESYMLQSIIIAADKQGTRISILPFYVDYLPSQTDIELVGDVKLFNLRAIPLDNMVNAFVKRFLDIVLSLVVIVLFWWIYVIAAIGVKLSSPGPIIFRQERIGKNKKHFTMYKFRSMRVNDESTTAWSTDSDPRKTPFGSFIRKYSIDEFPQFINVLKGDMSIVGPRPEIPYHVDRFKEEVPFYMVRHQVRPGITGWAQINGFRGDTSVLGRAKLDVWYVENWSLGLDIRIFFKTIFGGFANEEKLG